MIVTERTARKFAAIVAAEDTMRNAQVRTQFGADAATRARAERDLDAASTAVGVLIDGLTAEEGAEFGAYRLSVSAARFGYTA